MLQSLRPQFVWSGLLLVALLPSSWLHGEGSIITMKSGMQFRGDAARIGSLNENPLAAGEVAPKPIVIVDDELRRTFVPFLQLASSVPAPASGHVKIAIPQRVATSGRRIGSIGAILDISRFDEYGRRTFSMQGPRGRVDVIQGITLITPTYTKVQGLVATGYIWDMRIATSSIPRSTLSRILRQHSDEEDPDDRLKIVNLYLQSERYRDALTELEGVVEDFPDLDHLRARATGLRQLYAQHLLREITARRDAGQHQAVQAYLKHFPTEGIAGETLLRVRETLGEYEEQYRLYENLLRQLQTQIGEIEDASSREELASVYAEIENELNFNTLNRMADYLRFADDDVMTAEQKTALAVSGWLLGSGEAKQNLAVAISLWKTRNAVTTYLASERPDERQLALASIRAEEGGAPAYLAGLLKNLLPPRATQESFVDEVPGFYRLQVPGIQQQPEFNYYLQLPPEYDPHRRYPCVVTLHGTGTDARQQIDWWAGGVSERTRLRQGQAARRGFIVIAPEWTQPLQSEYEYTAREHAAVLFCLRDACQRTSIDTDRVFLSGHSMGGEAAWDIGLAHPDLWAGVVPLVSGGAKYIDHYHENGRDLPLYFVGGEKDGGWLNRNGVNLDRYLRRHYDTTVVQYQGRGHEHFQDEIQRIFAWMELGAHRRSFFLSEFEVVSLRPWDNYFYYLELGDFPRKTMVQPAEWVRGSKNPSKLEAEVRDRRRISVKTSAASTTIWLSPELVDFDQEIEIVVNGRKVRDEIKIDAEVLLEDARTRGDRQHPFWSKVDVIQRRRSRG